MAAASGQVMSCEEVDAELKRLQAEEDEISAALLELEDHAGYRLLDRFKLTGVTAQRWRSATTAIGTLWDGLAAHKQAVQSAADIRARRQHPGQGELAELTSLLTGRSAELTGPPLDAGISHLHALLIRQSDGSWQVVDPGSANGTLINDRTNAIEASVPVPVRDGDQIHISAWTTIALQSGGGQ